MKQPRCQGTKADGSPCRSFALPGGEYCIAHDPERAGQAKQARSKGGTNASKMKALKGKRSRLSTLPQLVKFTAEVIHDTLGGMLPVEVARAVLYGLSIQKDLVETGDLVKRFEALEQAVLVPTTGGEWK